MKISVILPVYNGAATIQKAIDSILCQTVPVAEIVLIDDGSTDSTPQIVQKYGAAVRYLHYTNGGLAVARNRGIDQVKSEWIAFLDADDEWLPHYIESHVRLQTRNPEVKWSSCHHEYVNVIDGSRWTDRIPQSLLEEIRRRGTVSFCRAQLKGLFGTPSGVVIRRSVFDEAGRFDPAMRTGQDGDMWCRIALRYPRIAVCPEVCWRYYVGNPNALHQRGAGHRDLQLKSLCKNMRHAIELGPDVVKEFSPFARTKAVDYLMRAAGRQCRISSETIRDANSLFPLTVRERMVLAGLRHLPGPIACRLAQRLRL